MDPMTMMMLMSAGSNIFGSVLGDRSAGKNRRAEQSFRDRMFKTGQGYIDSQGQNPWGGKIGDFMDTLGKSNETGQFDLESIFKGSGMNLGNDSLMQMLRADPSTQMDAAAQKYLTGTVEGGGNPFDTSGLFSKLGEVDDMNLNRSATALRGSAGSLGQRFGSALGRNEALLRADTLKNTGARNAGIQSSAYEAAQGRAGGAAGMLSQNMLNLLGIKANAAEALNRSGQNEAGLRLQGQSTLAGNRMSAEAQRLQAMLSALGLGSQTAAGDRDFIARIFGGMQGQSPVPGQASSLPGAMGDAGMMFAIMQMMKGMGNANLTNANNAGNNATQAVINSFGGR